MNEKEREVVGCLTIIASIMMVSGLLLSYHLGNLVEALIRLCVGATVGCVTGFIIHLLYKY